MFFTDRQMFLGGVLDETNSDALSVGFGRYQKGESNEWVVTYDEACIVTKGAYKTAKADEVIFLTKGTKVTSAELGVHREQIKSFDLGGDR